jgi:hypothetical protein
MGLGFKARGFEVANGYKQVIDGVDINSIRVTGLILTASTEPSRESLETSFEGLVVSSSQTVLGDLTFTVPRNYDKAKDKMRVRFLCNSAGDTNTPTIDAALYRKRAGAALSSDLDPTISASVNNSTALADWVEVDADGLGLEPGDAVTFVFTTSAHTTDALNVYAVEVVCFRGDEYNVKSERSA